MLTYTACCYLQSNLYHTARVRKMGFFEGFKKKACVCVVSAEERRRREKRRDDGVPEVSLDDLKTMQCMFRGACLSGCGPVLEWVWSRVWSACSPLFEWVFWSCV